MPENETEYEVECILDCKKVNGRTHFLVKWKNYGPETNTWEPVAHLVNCESAIDSFNKRNNRAVNDNVKRMQEKMDEIVSKAQLPYILVENMVDDSDFSNDFTYIIESKPCAGVQIIYVPLIGCECNTCVSTSNCCAQQMLQEFAYNRKRRLILPLGHAIYECNSRCRCGAACINRVVQNGRKVPLCIFRTSNGRGWGVKAMKKMKKGTFVVEYVGEVLTMEAANRREDSCYMVDLDFANGNAEYVIDAKYYGNVSRYINHSCRPNLAFHSVWIDHYEHKLPRLALFAVRDIEDGEELTLSYRKYSDPGEGSSFLSDTSVEDNSTIHCKCGSDQCSGYFFKPGVGIRLGKK